MYGRVFVGNCRTLLSPCDPSQFLFRFCMCVDGYAYVTTFTLIHMYALCIFPHVCMICMQIDLCLIFTFMCLFMYVCMYSCRQTGIRSCIYMYVYADGEQSSTARSRDTLAPATRGIASNARLAVCCLYRMGLRRCCLQRASTVTRRQQPC